MRDHRGLDKNARRRSCLTQISQARDLVECSRHAYIRSVGCWLESGRELLVVGGDLLEGDALAPTVQRALRADRGMSIDTDEGKLFVQPFNPPLRLIVVGAVHIAQALVPMASLSGYEVTVVDPRRAFANDRRFPDVAISQDWPDEALETLAIDARAAVVTLTHDPKLRPWTSP